VEVKDVSRLNYSTFLSMKAHCTSVGGMTSFRIRTNLGSAMADKIACSIQCVSATMPSLVLRDVQAKPTDED